MEQLNGFFGIMGGLLILAFSGLVIKLYAGIARGVFQKANRHRPEVWFAHGIVVGFTAVSLNAFLWKLAFRLDLIASFGPVVTFMRSAGGYFDLLIGSLTAWAGFCHLYSAYLNLIPSERRKWTWVTIPFYPHSNVLTHIVHKMVSIVNPGGEPREKG